MSNLSDFLEENGIDPSAVVARSKAMESRDAGARALGVQREAARRAKKSYDELSLGKPESLGRGVSLRTLNEALAGHKIPRIGRRKITRAVNALLVAKSKDEVDFRVLFGDVGSRKGKSK